MKKFFKKSSSLFKNPSFFKGIARIFDLFGQLDNYNYSKLASEADAKALKRDWQITGDDIFNSIKKYGTIASK